MTQVARLARAAGIQLGSLELSQDNHYSMAGSILRGDMRGGAQPAEVVVKIESDGTPEDISQLVQRATLASPAHAVMRDVLANEFSIALNGVTVPTVGLRQAAPLQATHPAVVFRAMTRASDLPSREAITKLTSAERLHGVDGGAGTSLQTEQHRTLHIHGDARLCEDGLLETTLRLFRPVGSSFRFVGDPRPSAGGDHAAAPDGLAYLVAGIAFCYMTQLGRYAHIVKLGIRSIHVVQDATFDTSGGSAHARPLVTHVFVDTDEPVDAIQRLARMGEQTCFLHAAMRSNLPSRVRIELNGEPLSAVADPVAAP